MTMLLPRRPGREGFDALGFDPAPGEVGNIETLITNCTQVPQSLEQAHQALTRIGASSGTWQGQAADNFRDIVGELPDYLAKAYRSLGDAAIALEGWHTDLGSMQRTAADLERQAQQAQRRLEQSEANPDLGLAGRFFPDGESLQAAQQRLEAATERLHAAQQELEAIREQARRLLEQHEQLAQEVAKALQRAKDIAPEEPPCRAPRSTGSSGPDCSLRTRPAGLTETWVNSGFTGAGVGVCDVDDVPQQREVRKRRDPGHLVVEMLDEAAVAGNLDSQRSGFDVHLDDARPFHPLAVIAPAQLHEIDPNSAEVDRPALGQSPQRRFALAGARHRQSVLVHPGEGLVVARSLVVQPGLPDVTIASLEPPVHDSPERPSGVLVDLVATDAHVAVREGERTLLGVDHQTVLEAVHVSSRGVAEAVRVPPRGGTEQRAEVISRRGCHHRLIGRRRHLASGVGRPSAQPDQHGNGGDPRREQAEPHRLLLMRSHLVGIGSRHTVPHALVAR